MSKINVKNLLEKILEHLTDEFYVFVENEIQEVILEFVKHIERLIEKCENIDRNDVRRCYVDVYWLVKLKREYQEKLK